MAAGVEGAAFAVEEWLVVVVGVVIVVVVVVVVVDDVIRMAIAVVAIVEASLGLAD